VLMLVNFSTFLFADDGDDFRLLRKKSRKTLSPSTQDLFYVKLTGLLHFQ